MTTAAELDALIEELTVDAYGDEEQLSSFLVGAEEALVRGEPATIAGTPVEVTSVDCGPDARTGLTARVLREGRGSRSHSPTSGSPRTASSGPWLPRTGAGRADERVAGDALRSGCVERGREG
jgi:hypothetical protein